MNMKRISHPFISKKIPADPSQYAAYISELLTYIDELEGNIDRLQKAHFTPKSERFVISDHQGALFDEAEAILSEDEPSSTVEEVFNELTSPGNLKKKRKKQLDTSNIKNREQIYHEPEDAEKICECCHAEKNKIGEDKTEKIEIIPASVKVIEHIYPKFACKNKDCGEGKVVQSKVEPTALPKIKATNQTLAFIATQKYQYALPLYRIAQLIFLMGLNISRVVLSKWMIALGFRLKPIYNLMEKIQINSNYLHMDESRMQVLLEKDRKATAQSFVWIRRTGDPNAPPIITYHYNESRSGAVAKALLQGFSGYLQTDDYGGYESILMNQDKILHLLCWDHTRRYFVNALDAIPESQRKNTCAEQALLLIQKLYKIERRIKNMNAEDRLKIRQEDSIDTLNKLKTLLEGEHARLSSHSLTSKAIKYTLDNWEKLNVYTTNSMLNISNAPAEQTLRPFVVGRKNWLFACTPNGAEASAIIYSIIQTALANNLNPFKYLKETLDKLPYANTEEDLMKLLPISSGE